MPRPTLDQITDADTRIDIEGDIDLLVRRIAHALTPDKVFATAEEALAADPATARADRLGLLSGAEALHAGMIAQLVRRAHHLGTGPDITYADLGTAVGITRQAARDRWPGAVKDAKPGRPRKQTVEVLLHGGPPSWAGSMQEYERDSVLDCELGDVGAYLIVDGDDLPEDLESGVDWRAHYAPEAEGTRTTWVFQGWVPS